VRAITVPRGGLIRTRPPMVEYDLDPAKTTLKADMERSVKTLKELLKESAPQAKLKSELMKKAITARTLRIA